MQTAEGAKIEIEDVSALAFYSKKKHEKVWSKTEKINFMKKINRLMSRGVIKPISNSENGFVSSIFLREKKENKHHLILNLKEFNKNVVYRHFKVDILKTALYCKDLQDLTVLFKIDNTSTVSWVNKQSGPDKEIFTLGKQIWEFCIDRNINVVASYIESKKKEDSRQRISEDKR